MNRERAKELLPVIQAFAAGEFVECKHMRLHDTWSFTGDPTWNDDMLYRIRPKPVVRPWSRETAPKVIVARRKDDGKYMLIENGIDWHEEKPIDDWWALATCYVRVLEDGTTAPCGTVEQP